MKALFVLVAVLTLCLYPQPAQAQDTALALNLNVGANYATGTEAFGASIMALKKLGGGWFEISVQASFGEANNSIGFFPGLFVFEGGPVEVGLLHGITSKWEPLGPDGELINYILGSSGLYVSWALPWEIIGQETRLYGLGQREFPYDSENLVEATYNFGIGISLTIR